MPITHPFVSAIPDEPNTSLVRPSDWNADHTGDMDDLLSTPKTGEYHIFNVNQASAGALAVDRLYAYLIKIVRPITFDRIAIQITIAAAAGKLLRLGIYNVGANLIPGTLLLDAGAVAADAVAIKEITISQQLTKGYWWVAAITDGTPTVVRSNGNSPVGMPLGIPAASFSGHNTSVFAVQAYGALPSTFPAYTTQGASPTCPLIPLRVLSLD